MKENSSLRILYHILNPSATGADRWIYEGWKDAFLDLGYQFYELTEYGRFDAKANELKPDVFITSINIFNFDKYADALYQLRKNGTKVFMMIYWPTLEPACLNAVPYLLSRDLVDVYFGEREPEDVGDFEKKFKKPYYVIPNAANKKLHYPTKFSQKYDYDIVYLGAKLPHKAWFTNNILLPLAKNKNYKVGIFGPYWTFKDNALRVMTRLFRYTHFESGVEYCNNKRIVIPAEDENLLYSSAKICLNFHERDADGTQSHIILNQRTFKIPACGGFQICDESLPVRKYFDKNELVTVGLSPSEWFEAIDYYLNKPEERLMIKENGSRRALAEHTYHHRIKQLLDL